MAENASTDAAPQPSAMPGATALVTGGAGFIGSRLCSLLRQSGWVVHSASRRSEAGSRANRHWQVDLTDPIATQRLVDTVRADYVFHLASHVWPFRDLSLVLPTFHSNLQTTVNLLHALAETSCRSFIFTGSQIEPDTRVAGAIPNSPYTASKWAGSDYVRMFHALYEFPATIARVFMVYGPGQNETKLIPYVIRSLLQGKAPQVTSGRSLGDWVFVDDVAFGLARIAVVPGLGGRTIDLGSGTLNSLEQVVNTACELIRPDIRPIFGALPDRPAEPPYRAKIEETERILGWVPRTRIEDGIRRTILWCRQTSLVVLITLFSTAELAVTS